MGIIGCPVARAAVRAGLSARRKSCRNQTITGSAIFVDGGDDFWQLFFGDFVADLACSSRVVSAATIFQAEFTNIGFAGFIQNGFTDGKNSILLILTPHDMAGNIALLEK